MIQISNFSEVRGMGTTTIEWTDATWNPTVGCSKVSAGCKHCYANVLHDKRHKAHQEGKQVPAQYAKPFTELQLIEDRLTDPLHWKKPRRVFVNSVSDLFHEDVPDEFICEVFKVMGQAKQHTFQVLTKRAERMQRFMREQTNAHAIHMLGDSEFSVQWPYLNVWLIVSVENQKAADERIPFLLQTPASVRGLSLEPLLEEVNLNKVAYHQGYGTSWIDCLAGRKYSITPGAGSGDPWSECSRIDWVIVGGESGPNARPFRLDWAKCLRDQCKEASVKYFLKQFGSNAYQSTTSAFAPYQRIRLKDPKGGDPEEWPEDVRIREYP
jgi:protein gp37